MSNKKAQIVSLDLTIAIVLFSIIVIAIIVFFDLFLNRLQTNLIETEILNNAFAMSDFLVTTSGEPTMWSNTSVRVLGLADYDRVLSEAKLNNLSKLNYNYTKGLLKIDIFDYDYSILITDLNKTSQGIVYSYGISPSPSAKTVIKIRRYVIFKNETSIFELDLWKG